MNPQLLNLMVALGVGLLVGVERERTNLESGAASSAGLRTFTIASLAGAVAVAAGGVTILGLVLAAVGVLTALSYWRTVDVQGPGMTTELALLLTVLIGGLAMTAPAAAAAAGVITALLLASRKGLHAFAGEVLTEDELRSALILAAAVMVVLPLLPDQTMGPYGALNPRKVWRLVVLVLGIGAAGHVAVRALGPKYGLAVAGLASGFVSSSATIGAMGGRAARNPRMLGAATAGAVLSTVATVLQLAIVVGAISPPTLQAIAGPLICAGLTAAAYGAVFTVQALRQKAEVEPERDKAFSLGAAIVFALTLSAVLVAAAAMREWLGDAGALVAAAMAGFVDTHAAAMSIAALAGGGKLQPQDAVLPILAGFTTNTITKVTLAATAGGRAFGLRVIPGLVLVALAAWAGSLIAPVLG